MKLNLKKMYSFYLFSCLIKLYDKELNNLEYDVQFERIRYLFADFQLTNFNNKNKGLYECIIEYLEDEYGKRI